MLLEELFFEIGAILVIAAGLAFVAHRLRQPLIIAYIVTGVVAGPGVLALTRSAETFDVMSKIGVAFLLFTVGLGLNWRSVKDVGGIAFATGIGQILFTSAAGFGIAQVLGFDPLTSLYLAVAFSFSSTIIIVKLLTDKEELDTLYGRISVGFLLVQDFVAMLMLLALTGLQSGGDLSQVAWQTGLKALVLVPAGWLVSTKLVPPIVRYAARSQELLFVFAVAWCFLITAALYVFGFGIELGALVAGVTLSGTVYEREINARIRSVRDFFLVVFFIAHGTHISVTGFEALAIPTVVFSLFILIGNPLIALFILRSLGYHPRTGFLCGTTVAQISEFSFILLAAGIALGHVSPEVLGLAAAVGLLTIAGNSYLIAFNEQIYTRLSWLFGWLEPAHPHVEKTFRARRPQVILFGFHRLGMPALPSLRSLGRPYVIVDFDPQVIRELSERGEPTVYGDAGDQDFLEELEIEKAKCLISTIPDLAVSTTILSYVKHRRFQGTVIVSAKTPQEAAQCYKAGATYVIVPSVLGGEKFREYLEKQKTRRVGWEQLGRREQEFGFDATALLR